MARARSGGNGRLDEAMRTLTQAQAALVANQADTNRDMAETRRELAELKREIAETNRVNSEHFARIEAILIEHSRLLHALPDAVREKIGFKPSPAPPGP